MTMRYSFSFADKQTLDVSSSLLINQRFIVEFVEWVEGNKYPRGRYVRNIGSYANKPS